MNTFRSIREKLGLTQSALAEILEQTQGNIAHYERGQTVPPSVAEKLIAHAKDLGHSITFNDFYAPEKPQSSRRKSDEIKPH